MFHIGPEALFLIQGLLMVGVPYAIWRINFIKLAAPLVVVQIVLGVVLGPSILGAVAPSLWQDLFPASSFGAFSGLSWIAIVLFAFLTGLHFDIGELKGKGKSFAVTSLATIFIPFILLLGAGWWIYAYYPIFVGENGTATTFILGIAIAGSVTALPVLSATLIDMKLHKEHIGRTALGYATVNDGILWLMVTALLTIATAAGSTVNMSAIIWKFSLTVGYIVFMVTIGRFALKKLVHHEIFKKRICNGQLVGIVSLAFVSALATELIGVHYLLGAFVAGTIIPKDMTEDLYHKIDPVVTVVLLPFFFMSTGLKTLFSMGAWEIWILLAVVTIVSSLGKMVGTALPTKYFGANWSHSLQLGAFMQCKGLMEVIVLTIMLQAKLISPECFSGMLFMAIITTAITKPMVLGFRYLYPLQIGADSNASKIAS